MKPLLRDLIWVLPASCGVALLLSLLDGGAWWIGLPGYAALLVPGLLALAALVRTSGAGRSLLLLALLGLCLRLGLGVGLSLLLPSQGYENTVHQAGYIFADAYRRDNQAWDLAASPAPLWQAFDPEFDTDQYGGLLLVSSALYRALSPDLRRPWLVVLLGGLASAVGILLAYRSGQALGGRRMAWLAAWILTLYPEAVLLASSQMREPFLIAGVAMALWGVTSWGLSRRPAAAWAAAGLLLLVLFSPLVALVAGFTLAGWVWMSALEGRFSNRRVLFGLLLGGAGVLSFALLGRWLYYSASWDVYLAEQSSGWIQRIFEELPAGLHLPFMTGYGLTQPLLPAAVVEPAPWLLKGIGILRSAGWYLLLPLLVFAGWSIVPLRAERGRTAWLWLWAVGWGWILLSSFRAGGDQWDNPRYRAILLVFQALLAARGMHFWQQVRSPWLARLIAIEALFLGLFTYWYVVRYTGWQAGQVHVFVILALIALGSLVIIVGGWLMDRRARRS